MRHSKASLFLMEIMISILFFSITATVCIQLFVKAHTLNNKTEDLAHASVIAQNLSECYLNGNPSDSRSMYQQMSSYLPAHTETDSRVSVFYNSSWEPCSSESASFSALLEFSSDTAFAYLTVDIKDLAADETVYKNTVKKHIQRRIR